MSANWAKECQAKFESTLGYKKAPKGFDDYVEGKTKQKEMMTMLNLWDEK